MAAKVIKNRARNIADQKWLIELIDQIAKVLPGPQNMDSTNACVDLTSRNIQRAMERSTCP
ncbi:MAG: hypothetical protein IPI00_17415 [Flavobacteriales bacterium]|nr:hypothetical protein [Flavobacteriales bacterium]MBK6945792.1 hypothetical protein [Flavobacteriales bacterium]MBK7241892.1 hypothetical protein [Flavobacteriales bacterium]MBK7298783.1 hypothetical protein [Flavobacteriales bacterium]MBK9534657.1 hypothetical protein [Flavobacteriales bacterium]